MPKNHLVNFYKKPLGKDAEIKFNTIQMLPRGRLVIKNSSAIGKTVNGKCLEQ